MSNKNIYITKRFTQKEIWWLNESLECMLGFDNTDEDVNTIKKLKKKLVDKILSEKPKKSKPTIDNSLHNLIEAIMSKPKNELIGNLNYVIDNLNELGIDYKIELKTK